MKTFSQFLNRLNRKYVAINVDSKSQRLLSQWAQSVGFDLTTKYDGTKQDPSAFDFHTTIFYSTTEHDTMTGEFKLESPVQLTFKSFELLGENHDIPVLKVDTANPALMAIRNTFVNLGYKDQWPEYKPHISLTYAYTGTPKISDLQLPTFEVWANLLKIKDI